MFLIIRSGERIFLIMNKLSDWERIAGVDFLKKAGIKKGYKVLEFGCNDGNYTIPASAVVGEKGTVFAIDENKTSIEQLEGKIRPLKYDNIEIMETNGALNLNFRDDFIDFVMLYDVLHYFTIMHRRILYKEVFRILKSDSVLSVYPKHIIGNFPLMEFRNMSLNELMNEIQDAGFKYSIKICSKLSHDGHLEEGCIINFVKM